MSSYRGGGRSEISERDFTHRRAPVRTYDDDLDIDVNVRERSRSRGPVERTPAFLREDHRRAEAGPLVLRAREVETVDRRRPRSPSPQVRYRERVIERERGHSPLPERRPRFIERSPSPPHRVERVQLVERRRERTPTPEREREHIRLHFERERQRARTPSPSPSPSPPPAPQVPQVIQGPIIERQVITHYRDIDHGVVRAKPPTPPPQPPPRRAPSRTRERELDIDIDIANGEADIDIRRRTRSRSRARSRSRPRERPRPQPPQNRPSYYDDDDLVIVRNRDRLRVADVPRRRAHSAAPRPEWDEEAEYITGKIDSRGRMGEARNGATKDWAIVDVPPGTERVRMDGVGGGSAEVTWQRYNGVRRSKFIPERDDSPTSTVPEHTREPARDSSRERLSLQIYDSRSRDREIEVEDVRDRRISIHGGGERRRRHRNDMWTEITKDLVNREAIERLGYDYDETEYFFYVMKYLQYEDVLELVNLTEDIRLARKRAREQEERDYVFYDHRHRSHRHPHHWDHVNDERIVEREILYDSAPRGYYR
ncbi:hypothetical protein GGS20DRAFT_539743 [Poronia punctata]|nr:hypothetical protein GGS20DRAFT_539743 [Poronia punctata]